MCRFPRLHVLALAALTVAMVVMTADAQPQRGGPGGRRRPGGFMGGPGGPGMMGRGGGGVTGLLRSPQVQEELKLTETQKEELQALGEKLREQRGGGMREAMERLGGREALEKLSEEERRAKFQALMEELRPEMEKRAKEAEKEVAKILKPDQFKRLKQIEVQRQGVDALQRADIIQALGLTEDQQKKIKEILDERNKKQEALGEEMRGMFQGGFRERSEEEREQLRAKMEGLGEKRRAIQSDAQKNAMGLLTDDQKAMMPKLMGEPFEFRRPEGGPGGRRPGAPGQGRRGEGGEGGRGEGRRGRRPGGNQ